MTVQSDKLRELFLAALKVPAGERDAFLRQACAGADELRERVKLLIQAHEDLGSIAPSAEAEIGPTIDQPMPETAGAVIGRYKLIEQIGEGGMATVWMSQQSEPVKRVVALKLIKAGMDSKQVIARFEAERQALALMDHPNISRVLDGGTTSAGRPYFVMDLVKGVPITKYCDAHRLTPRQRLELFIPVCQAVQHAHQKGIIHRDLKPSNVLVALYDGKPVPKVIDFGVAKAAGQSLTDKTLVTGFGNIVGTLEYMSPEQAEINQLDIDTRSDIYALGVLLYELVAGSPPFSRKELEKAGMLEMLRVIREKEPAKPSTKLSTAEGLPTLAANRGTEPAKLTKLVRGELDWIVMKALEKDRNRRFETANAFVADVQSYLNDQPVQACPPSAWYRFRKFARRNKRALATVGLVVLALVAGTAISIWQAVWAIQAEKLANERLEREREARSEAVANLRKAREAGEEFFTLVSESRLLEQPGLQPLRKELLEAAVRHYEGLAPASKTSDPETLADMAAMQMRLVQIYIQTNLFDRHITALEQAVKLAERLLEESPNDAALHTRLAGLWHGGRSLESVEHVVSDRDRAIRTYRNAIGVWEKLVQRHPHVIGFRSDLSKFHDVLANQQLRTGQRDDALRSLRRVRELREGILQSDPGVYEHIAELAHADRRLALEFEDSNPEEAEALYRRAVDLQKDAPNVPNYQEFLAETLHGFGAFLTRRKRPEEASQAYRQACSIYEKLAAQFPYVSSYRDTLDAWMLRLLEGIGSSSDAKKLAIPLDTPGLARGRYYVRLSQWDKAVADYSQLDWSRPLHDDAFEYACLFLVRGDQEGYEKFCRSMLQRAGKATYNEGFFLARTCAISRKGVVDPAQAIEWAKQALAAHRWAWHLHALGLAYYRAGQFDQALQCFTDSAAGTSGSWQGLISWTWAELNWFGQALAHHGLGHPNEAQQCLWKGILWLEQKAGKDSQQPVALMAPDWLEVQLLRREAEDMMKINTGANPKDVEGWNNRGVAHNELHQYHKALTDFSKAIDLDPKHALAWCNRGWARNQLHQFDKAIADYSEAIDLNPQNALAWTYWGMAYVELHQYHKAIADLNEAMKLAGQSGLTRNNLAWLLATCPDAKFRDAGKAVALAKEAVQLAPKEGPFWNTMGAAHYCAGSWKDAVAALEKSMELRKGGDSFDWFFLTMAHWQLGDKEKARTRFDQAVQWMEKNQPKNDELRRFRAAAADLLGVTESKK
jgi:tetratricopeptide (TPR) repeat protein